MQAKKTVLDPFDLIAQTLWLGVVAALWGGTNPLMKKAGAGIEKIQESNCISQFFNISLVVPITNSLTFIFTLLSGYLLKENIGSKNTYIGVGFVATGVSLCVLAKL
ncbi:DgyrCDS3504 [Dimorphilus gyrociliatus]|uniref:DgyrCDS3504 n=1 Tax=Dimorphilus gyrociliatus TaxID=2664684 RepID=A0A7I8VFC1_9ANNE|nr:DgyrCDS3504 [Dimorphilus gyrociliatus]